MGGAEEGWADVDRWFESALLGPDAALDETLRRNAAAGLPPIDVSPLQGRLLELLATIGGARRIWSWERSAAIRPSALPAAREVRGMC